MKNSQFFREKSAKSFRSQNSLDMEPAVYLPARKGGRHLKDIDGMTYALSKRRENKTYYFCTQRNSLKCPATAIVDNQSEMIVAKSGSHMHDSNLMKQMVREMEGRAIQAAAENNGVPRSILGNLTNHVGETTQGKICIFSLKCRTCLCLDLMKAFEFAV